MTDASHAFLYSGGVMQDLGTLGMGSSFAHGINNNRQVTGDSQTTGGASHAFLYSNGTMNDLGTLGGSGSQGIGINAIGQVVGTSYLSGRDSFSGPTPSRKGPPIARSRSATRRL